MFLTFMSVVRVLGNVVNSLIDNYLIGFLCLSNVQRGVILFLLNSCLTQCIHYTLYIVENSPDPPCKSTVYYNSASVYFLEAHLSSLNVCGKEGGRSKMQNSVKQTVLTFDIVLLEISNNCQVRDEFLRICP